VAHHERAALATAEGSTQGALGTPPEPPVAPDEAEPGFDFWLFGLLVLVVVLVSIQNVWLRRRAERERGPDDSA
jgi:hypothetical protein